MTYKLYAVRVFSHQWREAVQFYEHTIGLPLIFSDADMGWAQFDLGGCYLGVERSHPQDADNQGLVGRFVGISISVPDIDRAYKQLSGKGVEFTAAPERQPWGGVLAHFKDPDGNVLTLLGSV